MAAAADPGRCLCDDLLLPVTRLDDSQSPYAAKDLFDVDHAYLMDGARGDGLDQFEGFVARGMPQGVEWGAPEKANFIGIRPREPRPGEPRFAGLIRLVNELLAAHAAFRRGGNCEFVDNEHDSIIAAFRRDPDRPEGGFLVACNFDIHRSERVTCDLARVMGHGGRIEGRERLCEREVSFDGPVVSMELPPCGATVWELSPA